MEDEFPLSDGEAPEPDAAPATPPAEIAAEDVQMLLLAAPERVMDIVAGLDEGRLRYRHGPAFPTAGEVAAHVATAGLQFDHFLTAVALETGPPPAVGGFLHPEAGAPPAAVLDLLMDWQRVRRRGVDLLRGLALERWDAPVEDPEVGTLTVIEACRLAVRHELGHLAQLRNLTALVPEEIPLSEL